MAHHDYLIIGAGIIGLSMAREIRRNEPDATILVIDKEDDVARHASGRNSGILHAGFYYSADSLKARFTRDGNRILTDYCRARKIPHPSTCWSPTSLPARCTHWPQCLPRASNPVDAWPCRESCTDSMWNCSNVMPSGSTIWS